MIKKPYLSHRQQARLQRKLPPAPPQLQPQPQKPRMGLVSLRERMIQPFEEGYERQARNPTVSRVLQAFMDAPITDPVEAVFFPVGKDALGDAAGAGPLIPSLTPEHLETARRVFEAPAPIAVPPKVWLLQGQGPETLKDYGWREALVPEPPVTSHIRPSFFDEDSTRVSGLAAVLEIAMSLPPSPPGGIQILDVQTPCRQPIEDKSK